MSTDTKTVFKNFGYLRCDDFAAYLEEMAARGWHLESWGAGLKFRKGAPEQVTYAVEVFSDASEYDTRPEPNTKEFAEYCEAAGWQLVDAKKKFVIFKKLRPDAHPIMTDRERLEAVAKEEQKQVRRNLTVSGIWCLMRWHSFLGFSFAQQIFMYPALLLMAFWTVLFLASVGSAIRFLVWKHRWAKRIAEGQMLWLGRGIGFQNRAYNLVLGIMTPMLLVTTALMGRWDAVLFVGIVYAAVWLMGWLIARKRPDAVTNQIISVVASAVLVVAVFTFSFAGIFANEEPENRRDFPLYMEELGEPMTQEGTNLEDWSTVFGSVQQYTVYYEPGVLRYAVYRSDLDWVLDKIWKEWTEYPNWEAGDAVPWGAEEVKTRFGDNYSVRWEDWILTFSGPGEEPLTDAQIEAVLQALRP